MRRVGLVLVTHCSTVTRVVGWARRVGRAMRRGIGGTSQFLRNSGASALPHATGLNMGKYKDYAVTELFQQGKDFNQLPAAQRIDLMPKKSRKYKMSFDHNDRGCI